MATQTSWIRSPAASDLIAPPSNVAPGVRVGRYAIERPELDQTRNLVSKCLALVALGIFEDLLEERARRVGDGS